MDKERIFTNLEAEYRDVAESMTENLEDLNNAFAWLTKSKRLLAEAKDLLKTREEIALLAEFGETGQINGRNEQIRQLQIAGLLHHWHATDPDISPAYLKVHDIEITVDQASIAYEQAQATLSVLRNRARMIAGLANALAS